MVMLCADFFETEVLHKGIENKENTCTYDSYSGMFNVIMHIFL